MADMVDACAAGGVHRACVLESGMEGVGVMGLFDLISNTVEGIAEVAVNTAKVAAGVAIAPVDGGEALKDAGQGVLNGLRKVGSGKAPPLAGEGEK
jgi:hypothetical protein